MSSIIFFRRDRVQAAACGLLFVATILCSTSLLHAGGWPQEVGKAFIKITYGSSSSNTVYRFDGETKYPTDNSGATVRDFPLADRGLFLYLEYGITEDLTVIADAAMKRSIITSPLERRMTEGLADVGLAARYRVLSSGPHVLSGRVGITLPTGYRRDITPPLGSGIPTAALAAEYGVSFYPVPAYATATLGYRLRPSIFGLSSLENDDEVFDPNYADQVFAEAEAGYTFFDRVLVKGNLRYLTTTRIDDNDFDVLHPPETEQYLKAGGGVATLIAEGFGASVDLGFTPMGKKTANSVDIFIGLSWQGRILGPAEQSGNEIE